MRILSAIVLLLWAVCYGRCLAEQYGGSEAVEHQCCQHEKPEVPPPDPASPCGVCDFIKSGAVLPSDAMILDVPTFYCLAGWEPSWFSEQLFNSVNENTEAAVTAADPPLIGRMCEWMASTAAPVRGPNIWA